MSHPIFAQIPDRYHDRVIVTAHGEATITVENGPFEVPVILDADRAAMKLPPGRHPERRPPERPGFQPV